MKGNLWGGLKKPQGNIKENEKRAQKFNIPQILGWSANQWVKIQFY